MDKNSISGFEEVLFGYSLSLLFCFVCLFVSLLSEYRGVWGRMMPFCKKGSVRFLKRAPGLTARFSTCSLPTLQQNILIPLNLFPHLFRREHLKGT